MFKQEIEIFITDNTSSRVLKEIKNDFRYFVQIGHSTGNRIILHGLKQEIEYS